MSSDVHSQWSSREIGSNKLLLVLDTPEKICFFGHDFREMLQDG